MAAEAERSGLVAHPGRCSLELRPPLAVDKGTVLRRLTGSCTAACYLGDDLGDLPAFAELSDWAAADGRDGVAVAVIDEETAPEVAALADLTVTGPAAAGTLLAWLADTPLPGSRGGSRIATPVAPGQRAAASWRSSQPAGLRRDDGLAQELGPYPPLARLHGQGPGEHRGGPGDVEGVDLERAVTELVEGAGLAGQGEDPVTGVDRAVPPWPPG